MSAAHFQGQMERLVRVFGKNAYPPERAQIIWREVSNLSNEWFTKIADEFIGNCKYAPLMPEFREEIGKERERLYSIEKKQHTQEAKEAMSMYSGEDIGTICNQIKKRVQGGMDDDSFKAFNKMLTPKEYYKCQRCEDTRIYLDEMAGQTLCDHRLYK